MVGAREKLQSKIHESQTVWHNVKQLKERIPQANLWQIAFQQGVFTSADSP
jgi:hypothetical protein